MSDNKKDSIPCWGISIGIIASVAIVLSVLCCSVFVFPNVNWDVNAVSTAIILAFVGILSTFVVVNNYSQLNSAKNETQAKVLEIKNEFDKQINDMNNRFHTELNGSKAELLHLQASICFEDKKYDNAVLFYLQSAILYIDSKNIDMAKQIVNTLNVRIENDRLPKFTTTIHFMKTISDISKDTRLDILPGIHELRKFIDDCEEENKKTK